MVQKLVTDPITPSHVELQMKENFVCTNWNIGWLVSLRLLVESLF